MVYIIRPILRGRDIKRNEYKFADLYLIFSYFGSHKIIPTKYSAVYQHLKKYEKKLRNRGQCRYRSNGKPSTNSKYPGQHHWLELDNNPCREYMEDFNKQKIVFPAIMGGGAFFALDDKNFVIIAPANIIIGRKLLGLESFLISDICYFALRTFYMGGGIEGELKVNRLFLLPVPKDIKNRQYSEREIIEIYGLTKEETKFISSAVNSYSS